MHTLRSQYSRIIYSKQRTIEKERERDRDENKPHLIQAELVDARTKREQMYFTFDELRKNELNFSPRE